MVEHSPQVLTSEDKATKKPPLLTISFYSQLFCVNKRRLLMLRRACTVCFSAPLLTIGFYSQLFCVKTTKLWMLCGACTVRFSAPLLTVGFYSQLFYVKTTKLWMLCGGFLLMCEDFWRMFDSSLPTCAFTFLKWEISLRALIPLFTQGLVRSGSAS